MWILPWYYFNDLGTGSEDDVGSGKGRGYSLNVPLKVGLSGRVFLDAFTAIIGSAVDAYQPSAIIMQCGADNLSHDRLGGWNLDIQSVGHAVVFVLEIGIPTILLGGGGYESVNAARCWTFLTGVCVGIEVSEDVPEHEYWTLYKPGSL